MKKNSGEVVIGLLVGLAVGAAILIIDANNEAQDIANRTGISTSPMDVIAEQPAQSTITVIAPAAAGAGIGWLIDEIGGGSSKGNSRDNNINVNSDGGDVSITVDGDDQDNDTDNDENDQDNSGNTTENNGGM